MYKRQDEASAPLLLVAGQCCFLRLTERVETDTLRLSIASFVLPLFDTLRLVGVADEASAPLLLVVGQCCFLSLTPERGEFPFRFLFFFFVFPFFFSKYTTERHVRAITHLAP